MKLYDHKSNDIKWQKRWEEEKLYETPRMPGDKKAYILDMFPYPSGEGLHVGHPKGYIATDIYSRFKRMNGYDVLHPMGWDAFGLPAEQFALKNKVHPRVAVEKNVANFKQQLSHIGCDYDWSREINTTDPEFYKWTQWIFTKLYEKGLAYESNEPINWCPSCKTGLANEDLNGDTCERCDSVVEKKPLRQWVLKITEYADRMLTDLDTLNWPEGVKTAQKNWIGRSEGTEFDFPLDFTPETEVVFASNNKGKLGRIQKLVAYAGVPVTILTPKDVGISDFDVVEDGRTLEDNVIKKAKALFLLTQKMVLADDTGFFIDGEKIDPVTVKRNALNGKNEKDFTVEEVGKLMFEYYKTIAENRGGKVDAEWRNTMCVITKDGRHFVQTAVRPVTLSSEARGVMDPYFPLRPLYISKATGKHVLDQTEEEEMTELRPITEILKKLLTPHLTIFTTRADTLFGATFVAISAELASSWFDVNIISGTDIAEYIKTTLEEQKKENDYSVIPEKTGIFSGIYAINPATQEQIPVWIANYVLGGVGTGAIMAVPAHDERDCEFAKKYNLPIKEISLENSIEEMIEKFNGRKVVKYKIQDWVFARQRYWGEPFPVVRDETGKVYMVDESELPVLLPEVEKYEPTGTGESPLAAISEWVNVKGYITEKGTFKQSSDGVIFKRETNTMPQWAGSSWYYLRFLDPHNQMALIDPSIEKAWGQVDVYVGGDHATRHLIYARFWHKFLYDIGAVSTSEPFARLEFLGFILAEDGRKMSKRWGNVINPDDVVAEYGADTLRVYEMFMAPFEQTAAWSTSSIKGSDKFLDRVYSLRTKIGTESTIEIDLHKTVKKVTDDIENFKFNTAISQMMILVNCMESGAFTKEEYQVFIKILAPFAPHMTDQVWNELGNQHSVHMCEWPAYDTSKLLDETVTVAIQIAGKMRGTIEITRDSEDSVVLEHVKSHEMYKKYVGNVEPKKVIIVKNKIVNIVI